MGYTASGDVDFIGTWEQLRSMVDFVQNMKGGLFEHAIKNIGKGGIRRYKDNENLLITISLKTWDSWNLYSWFDFIHTIKKAVPELRVEAEGYGWYSVSDVNSEFFVELAPGEVWDDSDERASAYFVDGIK